MGVSCERSERSEWSELGADREGSGLGAVSSSSATSPVSGELKG